jgi:polygalacturonase
VKKADFRGSCIFLVALLTLLSASVSARATQRYLITEYGAKADSQTLNTAAIQATIDACAVTGGGTVVVPMGTFLTGALFLKTHVSLLIEQSGVLKGSTNPDDYPQIKTRWEGTECEWTAALINADGLRDISISRSGATPKRCGRNWSPAWPAAHAWHPELPQRAHCRPAPA